MLLGDGATCRQILTGQYIIAHHAVPTTNYIFALDPTAPWQTIEIFSDLILGGAYSLLGLNGVVLVTAGCISLVLTWAYQFGRLKGLGVFSGSLLLVAAIGATSIHWTARAHVFSYVPFLLMYFVLFQDSLKTRTKIILAGLIMVAWANVHGSFILGLFMILCKIIGDACGTTSDADSITAFKVDMAILGSAFLGSCINLRGINLYSYVTAYAANPLTRFNNEESHSVDFSVGLPIAAFFFLSVVMIWTWCYSKKSPRLSEFLVAVSLFIGGIYAMRLIPYFVLIALPIIADGWHTLKTEYQLTAQTPANRSLTRTLTSWLFSLEEKLEVQESRRIMNYPVVYITCLILIIFWLITPVFRISDFDPNWLPVNAVTWLKQHPIEGLVFNTDNWGDYIYWRTGKPVFIDEKGDYPAEFLQKYIVVFSGSAAWPNVINQYKIKGFIVPKKLPVVGLLLHNSDWSLIYQDALAVILKKKSQSPVK